MTLFQKWIRVARAVVWVLTLMLSATVLSACTSTIAGYSLEAYTLATGLKARSLAVVQLSTESFSTHAEVVDQLLVDIDAAYEFAAGIPNNKIAAEQWALLRDPSEALLGGYFAFWEIEEPGGVSEYFRDQSKEIIAEAFNFIICLEVNKQQASSCSELKTPEGVL
ncbi:hypothetical protein [Devosia alba]|uniref:hypothetical protein n=1 Tax=Devosia alba TaxID=3152360 RepID=UPI0032669151